MRLGVATAIVDGRLVRGDVELADGLVAGVGLSSPARRGTAVPGLVDLQVNGLEGVDLVDADNGGYRRVGELLLAGGVTAYLPTFITAPETRVVAALRRMPEGGDGPRVLGAHLEGPFLSPERLGVHPPEHRRDPDPDLLGRLLGAGPVRLVTIAPELPGAHALVRELLARGTTVSYGHSDATAEEAHAAFDLGVRTVTHLFNAMRPFHHRDPGIAGAALARGDVVVQLILDGRHVAPETALVSWRAARGRVALVSDATAVPGARTEAGVLAGGTASLIEAVRSLHELGASLEEAVGAATWVPARILGHEHVGRLSLGLPADVVVLSDELEVERVLIDGRDQLEL
ncbi:MAG: amidohydrolase family protein [Gaiellaceae bacterium]